MHFTLFHRSRTINTRLNWSALPIISRVEIILWIDPQYKIAESPVPSEDEEEESEEEDDGFGPKKPAVDPDDPVARK